MSPKFIKVTRRVSGTAAGEVMVNPRRMNFFVAEVSTQPNGPAVIYFSRGDFLCVMETVSEIKRQLS